MLVRTILLACILSVTSFELAAITDTESVQTIDKELDSLRMRRNQARLQRDLASRTADRLLTQDWLGYQRALAKQGQYEKEIEELDVKIKILEDQKQMITGKK